MPLRFYVAPKRSQGGLILIIIIGIILIVGLLGVAYYLNQNLNKNQTNQNTNQPVIQTNQNQPVQEVINQNLNANINLNENINVNTNANINLNSNTNINANANINVNTNVNVEASQPLPLAQDLDNDGLTLAEENLFNTNPDLADTDSDGYFDGAELLGGYDPTKKGITLANSGLFGSYSHPLYSITYPSQWTVKEQDAEKNEVLFTAGNGEFIEVLTIANNDKLNLADWYQREFPKVGLDKLTVVTINNLTGFRSSDNQNYYFSSPDKSKIFVIVYNSGIATELNFSTAFNLMVKSFKLLP